MNTALRDDAKRTEKRRSAPGNFNMNHRRPTMPESMKKTSEKGRCRWCDKPILDKKGIPRKVTWHPACVEIYKIACFSDSQRRAVKERDKGICAMCGLDTIRERRIAITTRPLWYWLARRHYGDLWKSGILKGIDSEMDIHRLAEKEVLSDMRIRRWDTSLSTWWHADHIRPLIESEGRLEFFLLENLQTLCHWCHHQKTMMDNRRIRHHKAQPHPSEPHCEQAEFLTAEQVSTGEKKYFAILLDSQEKTDHR